jgi:hypothetical protein
MKFRMSFFVTRPPRPVPCTFVGSTPCSEAIFATTGETNVFPLAEGAGSAAGGAVGAGVSAGEAASASAAASVVAASGGAS